MIQENEQSQTSQGFTQVLWGRVEDRTRIKNWVELSKRMNVISGEGNKNVEKLSCRNCVTFHRMERFVI